MWAAMTSRGLPWARMRPGVDDGQPVGEALGLVHEVGGQQDGGALGGEAAQALPDQVAGLGVEAGGGLVEDQQLGLVDQRPGQGEAALHAAGERLDAGVFLALEAGEGEQLGDARADLALADAEVAGEHEQVLGAGEVRVEAVELGHHADPGAGLAGLLGHRQAAQADAAGAGGGEAEGAAQGGGLAGAVGAEQREAFAGAQARSSPRTTSRASAPRRSA
jgi:hypothetical protein